MGAIASQITSLTVIYSIVYSDADHRKHQSSASLAFWAGIGEFPAKMARKMFPFDDVIMYQRFLRVKSSYETQNVFCESWNEFRIFKTKL